MLEPSQTGCVARLSRKDSKDVAFILSMKSLINDLVEKPSTF